MISEYNTPPVPMKNLLLIVLKAIKMTGLLFNHIGPKYIEALYDELAPKVASGEVKYREHLVRGLENAGHAILDVQKGDNTGKSVVIVAEE